MLTQVDKIINNFIIYIFGTIKHLMYIFVQWFLNAKNKKYILYITIILLLDSGIEISHSCPWFHQE